MLIAACWEKSSKRFHSWLIRHRMFGKMIRDWQANGRIPLSAKVIAISMMMLSCSALFFTLLMDKLWLAWVSVVVCLVVAGWMLTRPSR